ncbi:ASE1 [Sanghuangporus vaninii]
MSDSSPSRTANEPPLTISSLLESLHNHLQTQTQLLPTLHAQLGLPQSALTDELNSLHQRLASCVEEQIDLRRQEVDKWMMKCDSVERECIRYTKALGGHTKAVSASVGELRKQQVLPVRHEMLNQYLEKLDHLYKAKVEQLTNLTNRVLSLSNILGPEFFSLDLTEPPPAYGESVSDAKQPLREVTPDRFSKMEKELARGKGEINRRLQQLSATFLQMDWLYQELDIPPPSCDDDDLFSAPSTSLQPSTSRVPSLSLKASDPFLSSVSSISSIATPTPCPRGKGSARGSTPLVPESEPAPNYSRIYADFLSRVVEAENEGKSVESNPLLGLEGVQPTLELLHWAENTKSHLEEIKVRRETHIQAMYDQLEALWKRMGVEDEDIDAFVDNHRGSTEGVVRAYEEELERMLELKRESMSIFVGNARVEIEALWDELMYGEEERAEFAPFTDDEHSEDLLTTHEEEISRLKEEKRRKAPLLASIRKYFEICEGEKELAAAAADQSRLLGRGPRGDPGRLLREEKMRKRVMREKPRLEQELLLSIPAWEESEGRPFLVNGARMLEVLESLGATTRNSNLSQRPGSRAGSVPPRATTPQTGMKRTVSRSGAASSDSESNPAKRARVVSNTSGMTRARAVTASMSSTAKKEKGTGALLGRAPFGSSRAANTNATGFGSASVQKKTRTPSSTSTSTASSSATRTGSTMQLRSGRTAGIGLGYPSSSSRAATNGNSARRPVAASTSSIPASKAFTLMGVTSAASRSVRGTAASKSRVSPGKKGRTPGGRTPGKAGAAIAVGRSVRNRRESFRPRPSTTFGEGTGLGKTSRFGGAFVFSLKEEDEEAC